MDRDDGETVAREDLGETSRGQAGGSGASSTAEKPAALTRPSARSASAAMASRIVQSWSAAGPG